MNPLAIPLINRLRSMVLFIVLLSCAISPAAAAMVTLPSGQTIDLNRDQFERIKAQPGVFYVQHPKENIIPSKLTDRVVIDIPLILGGGFLIGRASHLDNAFAVITTPNASDLKTPAYAPEEAPSWIKSSFSFTGGYRVDTLDWNIAGYLGPPIVSDIRYVNILSELTWKDLKTFQLKLANRTVIKNHLIIKPYFSWGWIFDGENQDSDYACDDRGCEFSRSNNTATDDSVWDASIGLGPHFTFGSDFFELNPLVGYSYHRQNLITTNGYQTIPPLGSFDGLNMSYESQWYGPWMGLDLKIKAMQPLGIFTGAAFLFSLEYHLIDYYAQADWNLREDFAHPKSFEHESRGHGFLFSISTEFYYHNHWAFTVNYTQSLWQTDPGIDRVFFADGVVGETRLNEVNWRSYAFSIGFCYRL